jgi:hypothetical protein
MSKLLGMCGWWTIGRCITWEAWNCVSVFCWYALGVWDPSIEFGGLLQLKNA